MAFGIGRRVLFITSTEVPFTFKSVFAGFIAKITADPFSRLIYMSQSLPVLYSFRRCPYAMRARLAIHAARFRCELREIVLRDKALEMLEISPKGTVPVLVLADGGVLEESLDIMHYVLRINDPDNWLGKGGLDHGVTALIAENDGSFKAHLDRTKYPDRFIAKGEEVDPENERVMAMHFLHKLDDILQKQRFLGGEKPDLADMAILPFIRQFAHIDIDWFRAQPLEKLPDWLDWFLESPQFKSVMNKYQKWEAGHPPILFPQLDGDA